MGVFFSLSRCDLKIVLTIFDLDQFQLLPTCSPPRSQNVQANSMDITPGHDFL